MKLLDTDKLNDLASALAAAGYRVIAPIRDAAAVRLAEWTPGAEIALDEVPTNSVKEILLPRSEIIGRAKLQGNEFAMQELAPEALKTALLCVRPCDAAALALLDAVFNWGAPEVVPDGFYNARRAATTVVTLACATADDYCFCTSLGGSPDNTRGTDAMLRPCDGGKRLLFESLSPKGEALAQAAGAVLVEGQAKADPPAQVKPRFNQAAVTEWLAKNFDSPLWEKLSLACRGCGACAYACPTCHCFDVQDEANRHRSVRFRNWDSCGFALFTLHASGHNPRPNQSARWRQRVMHKLSYIPERFSLLGCTGCGRCARLCDAGMDIAATLEAIEKAGKSGL